MLGESPQPHFECPRNHRRPCHSGESARPDEFSCSSRSCNRSIVPSCFFSAVILGSGVPLRPSVAALQRDDSLLFSARTTLAHELCGVGTAQQYGNRWRAALTLLLPSQQTAAQHYRALLAWSVWLRARAVRIARLSMASEAGRRSAWRRRAPNGPEMSGSTPTCLQVLPCEQD